MRKCDEASPSIILVGRALLVKMLITLEPRYAFGSNFEYFFSFFKFCILMYFKDCPATNTQNGNEASPSIIFACYALSMKMLITLELRGIIC